jgi:3-mercaptopropionate dioxygenase
MEALLPDAAYEPLIAPIARAIRNDRVTSLAGVLADLCERGLLSSELFLPANPAHYARKLIWRDPDAGFVAVAMTWSAGQGSPLHDHAGLWGAEIVVDGTMSETTFTCTGRGDDGRYRFQRGMHRRSGRGTVGVIVPPLEYHDFGNCGTEVARTFHVYGGDLTNSQAFADEGDGWWSARRVELRYDA